MRLFFICATLATTTGCLWVPPGSPGYDTSADDSGSSQGGACEVIYCNYQNDNGEQASREYCMEAGNQTHWNSANTLAEQSCGMLNLQTGCSWYSCEWTGRDCAGDEILNYCNP